MVSTAPLAEQITERLREEDAVITTASLDEYLDVVYKMADEPYTIEYLKDHIRAKMSKASDSHGTIVLNIGALLRAVFYHQPDIRVMGGNKVVYIPACTLAVNPDALVMKGESGLFQRQGRAAGITNPYILIEVHSNSTEKNDLFVKLRCYKQLESVQHIMYIDQYLPNVSVYTEQQDSHHWLNQDYNTLDTAVELDGFTMPMQDIYHKVGLASATNA